MFSKSKNETVASSTNSSVDWECDEGSQSWASSASWSDDVETEATARLQQQLHDIESVLYGEALPKILPPALRLEVAQWRATFPHLRICGVKPPYGPRPSEPEEGQEEVYACHGECEELSDAGSNHSEDCKLEGSCHGEETEAGSPAEFYQNSETELAYQSSAPIQIALHEQIRKGVLSRLLEKLQQDVSQVQLKAAKEVDIPPVSANRHREPLLATRQSAQKDSSRRIPQTQDSELGTLLRVSPLPRRQVTNPAPRAVTVSSRRSVTLPPIDTRPESSRSTTVPLSVLGRQTRLIQQRTKILR